MNDWTPITDTEPPVTMLTTQVPEITRTTPVDRVCQALELLDVMKRRIRDAEKQLEDQVIDWINANGPFAIGTIKYYVGTKKNTKCQNIPAAVQALMEACGGDFDLFCQHLSANALKHGAANKTLPAEVYSTLFITETVPDLKTGKATKELMHADTRFLPGKEMRDTNQTEPAAVTD